MIELLAILTPVGLLDSASIVPLCIVIMVVLLTGARPVFRSFLFIVGVFLVYLGCGLLILVGLQSVFDEINAYVIRLWKYPETDELIVQVILGIILLAFGLRMARRRNKDAGKPVTSGMTAQQAFLAGAGLTIVGLPGAVPYFAAIDLILRADLAPMPTMLALGYYNVVFVLPLAAIVAVSLILGEHSQGPLDAIRQWLDRWGQRVIVVLLMSLGAILVADGVGWFIGYPLIPV